MSLWTRLIYGVPNMETWYQQNPTHRDTIRYYTAITYDNELQAILTACKNSFAQSNVQIQGEKGYITIDSASSMLSEIAVHKPNQEVEILNNQEDGKVHHYYMRYLLDLMKNDDFEGNNKRLAHTLEVIKIMVKARRSANIIFDADNKQI